MNNKYIIFTEYSMKKFKYNYYYIQYNDNELELEILNNMIKNATYNSICGAYSEFKPIDFNYIINGEDISTKIDGKFIMPIIKYDDNDMLGDLLNCCFYNGGIKKYFTLETL